MKIKYVLGVLAFAGIAAVVKAALDSSVEDHGKIKVWPTDKDGQVVAYCTILNYQACRENQWFGFERHRKIEKVLPEVGLAKNRLMDQICHSISNPPRSRELRVLYIDSDTDLVMCRLRDPQEIDRGRVLELSEQALL